MINEDISSIYTESWNNVALLFFGNNFLKLRSIWIILVSRYLNKFAIKWRQNCPPKLVFLNCHVKCNIYGDIAINYVDRLSIVFVAIERHCVIHGCVCVTDVSVTVARPTFNWNHLATSRVSTHCGTRSFVVHGCLSIVAVGIVCYTWNWLKIWCDTYNNLI